MMFHNKFSSFLSCPFFVFFFFFFFFLLLFASFASFAAERERKKSCHQEFLSQKKEKKFFLVSSDLHTHTNANQKRSRKREEEEDKEEVHPQNVSIWRRRRPKRKQQIVSVRSAIQSLPGLVHRPLGVGQRGQNHPTTERVGQIVATRRLGFPDVVQR